MFQSERNHHDHLLFGDASILSHDDDYDLDHDHQQ